MGYIDLEGVYHKEKPELAAHTPQETSVWKHSDHDRQRQDHKGDLVRPYNSDGTPNEEFINLYPEEAEQVYHFTKSHEELAKEQRNG
jgi:hypothetical protein